MRTITRGAVLVAALLAGVLAAGCGEESELLSPNEAPNTRVSAGPPEASDTGYTVNLFWFGWDDDGFVDHYEIAWETPENWLGPIFTNDSLFSVQAAESCCVTPLPDFTLPLDDSVYEQFHTFYVRSVDNNGVPDPTPAVRSFNANTIAPYTEIDFGPNGNPWGPSVEFEWTGDDEDGVVVAYERILVTKEQFFWDTGRPFTTVGITAWVDTLSYFPVGPGQRKDSLPWEYTEVDSVVYPGVPEFDSQGQNALYLFAVRAIDDAGAKEQILTSPDNVRSFSVKPNLAGPRLFLRSNSAGSWRGGDPLKARAVFAGQGLRFFWRATPGQSGTPVAGFSYAIEDTSDWTPFSNNAVEWPVQVPDEPEVLWFPPEGPHRFFVRAIDLGGFVSLLEARLDIFGGPKRCEIDPEDDTVLVVLDTNAVTMVTSIGLWPVGYEQIERSLVDYWFDGFNYQVFESEEGRRELDIALLNCSTSTVWFCSASVGDGDNILFDGYHRQPPNPLPSYVSAGGNLFVLGLSPVQGMRYFERADGGPTLQQIPVVFSRTLTDTTYLPHWAATHFGIARINQSIAITSQDPANRLRVAKAVVPGYPDLPFDPLTWPDGPNQRGFGYYDRDIVPITGAAEVIYRANAADTTAPAIGVRRLKDPQAGGSTVYLGFHPYYVERPAFRQLVRAVLTSFGETLNP
jgi:hypothetical protein